MAEATMTGAGAPVRERGLQHPLPPVENWRGNDEHAYKVLAGANRISPQAYEDAKNNPPGWQTVDTRSGGFAASENKTTFKDVLQTARETQAANADREPGRFRKALSRSIESGKKLVSKTVEAGKLAKTIATEDAPRQALKDAIKSAPERAAMAVVHKEEELRHKTGDKIAEKVHATGNKISETWYGANAKMYEAARGPSEAALRFKDRVSYDVKTRIDAFVFNGLATKDAALAKCYDALAKPSEIKASIRGRIAEVGQNWVDRNRNSAENSRRVAEQKRNTAAQNVQRSARLRQNAQLLRG